MTKGPTELHHSAALVTLGVDRRGLWGWQPVCDTRRVAERHRQSASDNSSSNEEARSTAGFWPCRLLLSLACSAEDWTWEPAADQPGGRSGEFYRRYTARDAVRRIITSNSDGGAAGAAFEPYTPGLRGSRGAWNGRPRRVESGTAQSRPTKTRPGCLRRNLGGLVAGWRNTPAGPGWALGSLDVWGAGADGFTMPVSAEDLGMHRRHGLQLRFAQATFDDGSCEYAQWIWPDSATGMGTGTREAQECLRMPALSIQWVCPQWPGLRR